jgi:hypothetical protein
MLYLSFSVLYGYNDNVSKEFADVFATELKESGTTATPLGDGRGGEGGPGSLIPFFALTCVFFIASLVAARKIGFTGGDMVIAGAEKARGWAQGKVDGGFRGTGNAIKGVGGSAIQERSDQWANSTNRFARTVGRGLTYAGVRDAGEKAYKNSPQGKLAETREKRSAAMDARAANKKINTTVAAGSKQGASADAVVAMERAVQNANQDQLIEALRSQKSGSAEYAKIVGAMSASQIDGLLKTKDSDFSPSEKDGLRKERTTQIQTKFTNMGGGSIEAGIAKASSEDLAAFGFPNLKPFAMHIPGSKMDELKSKLTATEFSMLESERKNQMQTVLFGNNPSSVFQGKKDSDLAKLPREIILGFDKGSNTYLPLAIPHLNTRVLQIILRENYLNYNDRQTLRSLIQNNQSSQQAQAMWGWLNTPDGKLF